MTNIHSRSTGSKRLAALTTIIVVGLTLAAGGAVLANPPAPPTPPPAPPSEGALPDCVGRNGLAGQECKKLGTSKRCVTQGIERCVTCEDSNGDGSGHWSMPHACSQTLYDVEFDLDAAFEI
ncbi:hypothetical protein RAS1_08140 [Phycisphaerae bacterium RAS1]|nr:hypothetical protein RAS1_08140 [Phycisphaerae bacterium RAS1]